ncbi:DNA-binding response regulator [Sesbania bispinosa]|nr:DNA-binding response regulator [Sesbania bispinosa]
MCDKLGKRRLENSRQRLEANDLVIDDFEAALEAQRVTLIYDPLSSFDFLGGAREITTSTEHNKGLVIDGCEATLEAQSGNNGPGCPVAARSEEDDGRTALHFS